MEFSSLYHDRTDAIVDLFAGTFTDPEGAEEGQVIRTLVADMFATVPENDLFAFTLWIVTGSWGSYCSAA